MLSYQQILHFRTFGYVTLRALLNPAEAATLRQEVTSALADAFGRGAAEPGDPGGVSGDYLPLAASRAPFSLSLIADDPRTFQSAAELIGAPAVPTPGIATRFTGDSGWHTRQGPDAGGVTFWADLEPHGRHRRAVPYPRFPPARLRAAALRVPGRRPRHLRVRALGAAPRHGGDRTGRRGRLPRPPDELRPRRHAAPVVDHRLPALAGPGSCGPAGTRPQPEGPADEAPCLEGGVADREPVGTGQCMSASHGSHVPAKLAMATTIPPGVTRRAPASEPLSVKSGPAQ